MILCVLQARVSSTRLPGKVLEDVAGAPMLERQIERVRRARMIDRLVVATSTDSSDDALAELCESVGVDCCRGSLDDVLDRFAGCAAPYEPDHVVRITGDCPLIDPEVIDRVIEAHLAQGCDYTSNTKPPNYPDGLDVEVMTYEVLERLNRVATLPSEREHVTLGVHNRAGEYALGSVCSAIDLSHLRWTVDEPEDLEFVRAVYAELYGMQPEFSTDDVLELIRRRPELQRLNVEFERNEGLARSLAEESDGEVGRHVE